MSDPKPDTTADQAPLPRKSPGGASATWAGLAAGLAVAAIATTIYVHRTLGGEIDALRESQRLLTADVASMRRTPIIDVSGAPAKGAEDAVVTLVEYSDYECPFCIAHFQRTMPEIEEKLVKTGRVRYVFRDLPIDDNHPEAIRAHEASRCAAEQNRFWEMHTRLFSAPGTHSAEALAKVATDAGLDAALYQRCMASGRATADIRRVSQEALSMGANGTPAFFFGLRDPATNQVRVLRAVSGAQPFSVFEQTLALVESQRDQK